MAMKVADLFGVFGMRIDRRSVANVSNTLSDLSGRVRNFTLMAVAIGGSAITKSLIGFNANVEDTKNQIAGMLALSRKTSMTDELANADKLYASIAKKAASLPGVTSDYTKMLGDIAQPVISAGLSMEQLENMTVAATVASKAFGIDAQAAARDIGQALRGQFSAEDQLTGRLLATAGFEGEKGRERFNKMMRGNRAQKARGAQILVDALDQRQIREMAERQGKSFSGMMATLKDSLAVTLGRVGRPLFEALGRAIGRANKWLEANQELVGRVADRIGNALVNAMRAVANAIRWVYDNWSTFVAIWEVSTALMRVMIRTFRFLVHEFKHGTGVIGRVLRAAFTTAGIMLGAVWKTFKFGVNTAISIATTFRDVFVAVWQTIGRVFHAVWGGISSTIGAVVGAIQAVIDKVEAAIGVVKRAKDFLFSSSEEENAYFEANPRHRNMFNRWNIGGDKERAPEPKGPSMLDVFAPQMRQAPSREWFDTPRGAPGPGAGPVSNVSTGDINISVNAPNADPKQVAALVGQEFDRKMSTLVDQSAADFGLADGAGIA